MIYPSVSIIFPNYNGGKEPLDCLNSITKLNYPNNKIEVIIVDNASTDNSIENILKFIKDQSNKKNLIKFKLIINKANKGFAYAVNQGINNRVGKYIFVANDDLVFTKKSITNLVRYAEKNNDVGILGGKIYFKNNKKVLISAGHMINKWTGAIFLNPIINSVSEPDWIQGCAMLIKKEVIKKIGKFSTSYSVIYFEDLDFCQRAKKAKYKVLFIPSATFYHGHSTTVNKNIKIKYEKWYKNKIKYFKENYNIANQISVVLFMLLNTFKEPTKLPILIKALIWNAKK